jgi:hypothetical protein
LKGSSTITRPITTNTAVTPGWPELRRLNGVAYPLSQSPNLNHIPGGNTATAYFRPQPPPELQFDTDMLSQVTLLGEIHSTRDLIYILNAVRHALGR